MACVRPGLTPSPRASSWDLRRRWKVGLDGSPAPPRTTNVSGPQDTPAPNPSDLPPSETDTIVGVADAHREVAGEPPPGVSGTLISLFLVSRAHLVFPLPQIRGSVPLLVGAASRGHEQTPGLPAVSEGGAGKHPGCVCVCVCICVCVQTTFTGLPWQSNG